MGDAGSTGGQPEPDETSCVTLENWARWGFGIGNQEGIMKRKHEKKARAVELHESIKRPPLERMDRILEWLRNEEYPNCSRMMVEFGVDRKTAWRDIEWMKNRKRLPIDYHDRRHGYFLNGPAPKVPAMAVTEREMFELYVFHQAVAHYRGTPLEQRLERFFRRFTRQLDNEEQFTLEDLGEVLSFRPFAPDEADARLFELVTRAVRERRWLRFDYRKPGEKKAEARRVKPYHVLEHGGRWYLLAYNPMRHEVRTYVLGRMREAAVMEERFERPRDFDVGKVLEKSLGVMEGKGDYQVVVEMDAWLTDILRGRRWHPSQVVEELPEGGSQLRLRLGCLEEIEQYVLSWGTHASVVGPPELRERVGKVVRELAGRYADAGM